MSEDRRISPQYAYQQRQRALGNCIRCGRPAKVNRAGKRMIRCGDCSAKVNADAARRRAARK